MTHRIGVTLTLVAWFVVGPVRPGEPKGGPVARKGAVSTHVLDTAAGKPAAGVRVTLERQTDTTWAAVGRSRTGADGRAADLYPPERPLAAGVYRFVFETGAYFTAQGQKAFFPRVEVIFQVEKGEEHYHVPLLLSPFGYTTYRGS